MTGVGIDAVDIGRFRAVLARRPAVADRLFTSVELRRAGARADAIPSLAARFAAKEAAMKALGVGVGAVDWHDVEVDAAPSGAPSLVVRGRAAARAAAVGVDRFHVSLTHTDTLAMATVLVEAVKSETGLETTAPVGDAPPWSHPVGLPSARDDLEVPCNPS
jgi:holo-[acyl-carrier protein] synthase